jgi:predicted XRE-type DNA-binding protein
VKIERYDNVFDALEDDPVEARHLKLRAQLMRALQDHIQTKRLTQAEAAGLLGVSQPRVSDLLNGKLHLFSIDMLVRMLARTGKQVTMRIKPPSSPPPASP